MASLGFIGASTRRLYVPSLRLPGRFSFQVRHARGLIISAVPFGMALTVASATGILALRQTDAVERSAQAALRRQFLAGMVAAPVPLVNQPAGECQIPAPVQFLPEQPPPAAGSPVAVLRIPSIDVDKVVVRGTGGAELRRGPGYYPGTLQPGRGGTFGVAGYRATYGAPFLKLDRLKSKDLIYVTTTDGRFVYQVTGRSTGGPGQNSSLASEGEERLVLTTTATSLRDGKRLVVTATLTEHMERVPAKVQLPAEDAGAAYAQQDQLIDSFQLNPLGRLAATNVTPRTPVAPPVAPPAAPDPNPAPPPPLPPPAPVVLAAPPPQPQPAPEPAASTRAPTGPRHRLPNHLAPACRNGIDDDGDGLIDFRSLDGVRQDLGCNGLDDDDE
ncbi:hypothetical protein BH23ACT12_BH23ACT12_17740 [soil metagenome]